jgi:hypothetical protein
VLQGVLERISFGSFREGYDLTRAVGFYKNTRRAQRLRFAAFHWLSPGGELVMALGFGNSVLPDFVEQSFVADLQ